MTQTPEDVEAGEEKYTSYYWVGFHNGGFVKYLMRYPKGDLPAGDCCFFTDYVCENLPYTRVSVLYEKPELLDLTGTYPLHPVTIFDIMKCLQTPPSRLFEFRAWHIPTQTLFAVHCFTNELVYPALPD